MDRLLCGDVGYGKTEVAMRAAFKAIDIGYQVAVLVPTTVLAEQHLRTFSARMAEFPFTIDALSRFATRRQQSEIIERLAGGSIDIVIGTHRLAQADVNFQQPGPGHHRRGAAFRRRGQRAAEDAAADGRRADDDGHADPADAAFVALGIRDISNLETPPEDRLPIETRIARFSDELIRHAVLRELNREGQIYFVHNRVHRHPAICREAAADRARSPHRHRHTARWTRTSWSR